MQNLLSPVQADLRGPTPAEAQRGEGNLEPLIPLVRRADLLRVQAWQGPLNEYRAPPSGTGPPEKVRPWSSRTRSSSLPQVALEQTSYFLQTLRPPSLWYDWIELEVHNATDSRSWLQQ